MRGRTRLAGIVGSAALLAAGAAAVAPAGEESPTPAAADGRFVVHEWGTFTSVQGADGLVLEGLSREEESLPGFVYSRTKVRDCPLRDKGWKGLELPADHVTQKMETPVMYFHSEASRKVRVRVDFVRGLLSQWFPVSDLLGPPEGARDAGPLDVSRIGRSFLQWDVEVLPEAGPGREGAGRPKEAPAVEADDPWSFAREVNASWIRTLPRTAPGRAGPVEAERYLFHRGLGNFPLPLDARACGGGEFVLTNRGGASIGPPIVMEVKGDEERLREVEPVPAGAERTTRLADDAWGPIADVETKLRALVQRRLVAAGLQEDEARAMVRTWARSWFRSEGTRVIWTLPRADVDALLPLSIDPRPDDLVRVLVGRTEIVTPETHAEVERAVRDHDAADPAARAASVERLDRLGRFLEPHLRDVLAKTKDAAVRRNAEAMLAKLRE